MYNSPFKNKDIDNINRVEPGNTSNAIMNVDNGDPSPSTSFRSFGRRSVSITKNAATPDDYGDIVEADRSKTINVYKDGSLKKTKNIKTGVKDPFSDSTSIEKTTHKYKKDGSLKTTEMKFKEPGQLFSHKMKRYYMPGVQEPTSDKSKIKHLHTEDYRPVSHLSPIRKYKNLKRTVQNLRGDTSQQQRLDEYRRSQGN
jgi:hypothetical protein